MVEMGPVEKSMMQNALREGLPIPDRIQNAPELQYGLYFYLQAFLDLDSERISGMGMGQIPHSKIRDYAAWAECDEIIESYLIHHIRVMDAAHIKATLAKQEKEAKREKQNGANTKRTRTKTR